MSSNPNEDLLEVDLFVETPDPELLCSICLCVMKDPQQLNICQHMFCRQCITMHFRSSTGVQTNFCPLDKRAASPSNIVAAPRAFVNIISRLQMRCFYEGCREVKSVEDIQKHADSCRFRPCGPRRSVPTSNSAPGVNSDPLNILVKMASPAKTIIVTITGNDTVKTLKLRIQEKEGINANTMVLIFKTKTLQDTQTLSQYGIKNSDILWVNRRFEGGA